LVARAYGQLDSFNRNQAWTVGGSYSLARELRYFGSEAARGKFHLVHFDRESKRPIKTRSQEAQGVPIGFLATQGSEAFLVFRGTMTTTEWLADLKVKLVSCPYLGSGKVHEGFLRTYELFRTSVLDSLKELRRSARLFISGHSLGAGLATLAAVDIVSSSLGVSPIVYTFASPRVGDGAFAMAYNALLKGKSFRIANTCDMVTLVPFPVPFLGVVGGYFTHVDTAVDFTTQRDDVEKNHEIGTYLEALGSRDTGRGLLGQIFNRGRTTSR